MLPNVIEYHKPVTVQEAQRLLRRRTLRTVPLAGGTGLLSHRDTEIQAVVDLSGLGLDVIRLDAAGLEIGAMTTLQALVASPVAQGFAGGLLATAAHHTATRPLRNVGTVGGTIFGGGDASDVVVALLALDAQMVTADGQVFPLSDLVGRRPTHLFTAVRLPPHGPAWRTAFVRVACLPSDQAIVNLAAAAWVEDNVCLDVRLAAGGVGPRPRRLFSAEEWIRRSWLLDPGLAMAVEAEQRAHRARHDVWGSGEYRSAMLGVLLQRAMRRCLAQEGA